MAKPLSELTLVKQLPRAFYPNLVTVINIFFGFYAIINAFKGDFLMAFWCITAGAIADAFDGKVARIVAGESEFGVQYDSLADVITFGVAPSCVVYNLLGQPTDEILITISFLPVLFGSLRLARFNVQLDGFNKTEFTGLPIPAAAFSIISIIPLNDYLLKDGLISQPLWQEYHLYFLLLVAFYSLLMMSTLRYETLPNFTFKGDRENRLKLIVLVIALPLLILKTYLVMFPFMFLFSFQGIMKWMLKSRRKKNEK